MTAHLPRRTATNRLLAALPEADYTRLLPQLETVSLAWRQVLYEPNHPIAHLYFPRTSVLSLSVTMADGRTVEVATVGAEGLVGLPVFLAAEHPPFLASVGIPGEAERIPAAQFTAAVQHSPALHTLLHRYTLALLIQVTQVAACNALHVVEARCARWLLMLHDRVGAAPFPLTQDDLAQTQGVRRSTINGVGQLFQKQGLIHYSRGRMTIRDRPGLEALACECYRVIRSEYDRLPGGTPDVDP